MTNILHIDASARPGLGGIDPHGSYSRRLTYEFIKSWGVNESDVNVRYRDVGDEPPAHIDVRWIEAAFGAQRNSPEAAKTLAQSNAMANELLWADLLVIGAPMYNFGIPSSLKAWIDHIVRLEHTFFYTPEIQGHPFTGAFSTRNVPVVLLSSRGDHGMDPGGQYEHMNHLEPAIKTALGFVGLSDIRSVAVEHQAEGGELFDQSLRNALSAVSELADGLFNQIHPGKIRSYS